MVFGMHAYIARRIKTSTTFWASLGADLIKAYFNHLCMLLVILHGAHMDSRIFYGDLDQEFLVDFHSPHGMWPCMVKRIDWDNLHVA